LASATELMLQAHLFNQSILERFIYPFHATFCLAAVGTNQFDRQFPESPSELGCAGTSAFGSADLNTACLSL
jgi:hypothetical protein